MQSEQIRSMKDSSCTGALHVLLPYGNPGGLEGIGIWDLAVRRREASRSVTVVRAVESCILIGLLCPAEKMVKKGPDKSGLHAPFAIHDMRFNILSET